MELYTAVHGVLINEIAYSLRLNSYKSNFHALHTWNLLTRYLVFCSKNVVLREHITKQ